MVHKKFFYKSILSLVMSLLSIGILVYSIDPLQQFTVNKYYVKGKSRQTYPGIVKNFNYDSIVIGTSTSQNILREDIKNILGLDAINVSLAGSTSYEQRKLMELVLETKKATTIIYGLDLFSYNRKLMETREDIPNFIYSKNMFSKIEYLFSFGTVEEVINSIKSNKGKDWINTLGYWGNQFSYSKNKTLTFDPKLQWGAQNLGALKLFKDGYNFTVMKENYDMFLNIVERYPNIKFKVYFPPYASLWWYFADKYENTSDILNFKVYIVQSSQRYRNLELYEFQDKIEIVDNLDNYKDMVHYSPQISKKIIEMIKKEDGLVNSRNYYTTIDRIKEQIKRSKINFGNDSILNSL